MRTPRSTHAVILIAGLSVAALAGCPATAVSRSLWVEAATATGIILIGDPSDPEPPTTPNAPPPAPVVIYQIAGPGPSPLSFLIGYLAGAGGLGLAAIAWLAADRRRRRRRALVPRAIDMADRRVDRRG